MEIIDLFNMTDEQITNKIYATHVHAKKKFDEDSLFLVVENVLKHSLQIADKLAQVNFGKPFPLFIFFSSFFWAIWDQNIVHYNMKYS